MLALHPPVDAPVARPFVYAGSPFARGLHRGIDLGAAPGDRVVAPCGGRVAYAGARAVTVVCAGRRVTLLPLSGVVVRVDERLAPGAAVARVGRDRAGRHAGLHLGVRRAGEPFGYEDPAPLLRRESSPPLGPAPAPGARRTRPRRPPAPRAALPGAGESPAPTAPWPAWLGAAAVALAAGGSARIRVRARAHRTTPRTAGRRAAQG